MTLIVFVGVVNFCVEIIFFFFLFFFFKLASLEDSKQKKINFFLKIIIIAQDSVFSRPRSS